MRHLGKSPQAARPALFGRAFCFAALIALPAVLAGPSPTLPAPPLFKQPGRPDPAEGRKALEQLRRQGIAGDYYLEFQLRVRPRRGEEWTVSGRMWAAQNDRGAISRVEISGRDGGWTRLLLQNGIHPAVWRTSSASSQTVEPLDESGFFKPIVPGTEITAFDLQMPFIYWNAFTFEGLERFRGRPTYVLVLRPPPEFQSRYSQLAGVRVHLDTQFNALVQTELLGKKDAVLKTLSIEDLKKIGEQWIPKTIDVRDETTRDKTRFSVTAAALGLDFMPALFEPGRLTEKISPPDRAKRVPVGL
jgi:hypothetical protein